MLLVVWPAHVLVVSTHCYFLGCFTAFTYLPELFPSRYRLVPSQCILGFWSVGKTRKDLGGSLAIWDTGNSGQSHTASSWLGITICTRPSMKNLWDFSRISHVSNSPTSPYLFDCRQTNRLVHYLIRSKSGRQRQRDQTKDETE